MNDRRHDRLNRFRFAFGQWLSDYDTRSLEFALAGGTIINGIMALYDDSQGRPLAPFLTSALSFLTHDPSLWAAMLVCLGILVFAALALGTRCRHDTRPRAFVMLICSAFYIVVTVAIITGGQPWVVALRYAFTLFLSLFCSVVLVVEMIIEQREREQEHQHEQRSCAS